jgi:PAS domain S-box-containing protein
MPPDATGNPQVLAILGPRPWADRLAADLPDALQGAKVVTCTTPAELPAVLGIRTVAAVVARLAADTPAAPLAAIAKQPAMPPLVICADDDARADALLDIMGAGAVGLARDGDGAGLASTIHRAFMLGAGEARPASAAADPEPALRTLADRIEHPLALVTDGKVWLVNRALRQLFGLSGDADLAGRPLADLAAPEAVKPLSTLLARALLLDLDDKTHETLRFVPAAGPAFAAEVTAAPITVGSRPGLAVQLAPTGVRAGIGAAADKADLRARGDERTALLQRLGLLTNDASPVERTSALALAVVADYAAQRRRRGFVGAARLVDALAECLAAAAPAACTLYPVADDTLAVLVEDVGAPELERLCRRLAQAPAESADAALTGMRLKIGVTRVAPGAGAPLDLLERALADAMPAEVETTATSETTEGLDLIEPGYSVDTQPPSAVGTAATMDAGSALTGHADKRMETAGADTAASALPRLSLSDRDSGVSVLTDGLMERIQRALEGEGFTLALQPIVSLMGDSREHYSVLIRLRRPDGGLASAAQIVRSAAGSGRMADIDRWMIRSALHLLSERRRAGDKAAFFISLSPDSVADEQLLIWICDALREFDVRGRWLTFQVQEQYARAEPKRWADIVAGLREVRCRVCVNDYGLLGKADAGAVGTPDFVKLAPTLAGSLSGDKDKQQRILELIRLTKAQGTRTIVTGVEDSRALNLLWDAGVEYVQGDYLQEPATSLDLPSHATEAVGAAGPDSEQPSLRL